MILVTALSPVWQRTLFLNQLRPGQVNRVARLVESASGKGINVARVASTLGAPVLLLTVAGGHRGRLFRKALSSDGFKAVLIPVAGETRVCQTLLGEHAATELVEEAPPLSSRERKAFETAFSRSLARASLVVLSGTVPRSCGDDCYARLARLARRQGVPVIVDTQRAQLLNVVEERPLLVKINRTELAEATGLAGVIPGARELQRRGATGVVISDGSRDVIAVTGGGTPLRLKPPQIKAVNPVGSGDAMTGGIAVALVAGESLEDALRLGIACGAANALTELAGVVRAGDVRRFRRQRG